jgi:hypothetical protein
MSKIFSVGPEVAHTPAYSKKTLFVIGMQDTAKVEKIARDNKTPHISLGADRSFNADANWDAQITHLLDAGFWVTLEYPTTAHEFMLQSLNPGIWQSRIFVPLLWTDIPCLETSNPNLTLKLDDNTGTNAGIWCMHFKELTDSNRFTDRSEFESTEVDTQPARGNGMSIMSSLENIVEPKAVAVPNVDKQVVELLNDTALGLDDTPTTALKADPDAVAAIVNDVVKTPVDAAEAYAAGATVDPLSAEASKKPKSKK